MTKALIHTPGTHNAVLSTVVLFISPINNAPHIRLTYRHEFDRSATLRQSIMWSPLNRPDRSSDVGAYIMSRIFSRLAPNYPERNASFWARLSAHDVVEHLKAFVNKKFEIVVELQESKANPNETFPKLKYSFCLPERL